MKKSILLGLISILSFVGNAQNTLPERGICAHRGAMGDFPENTLPSFLEAIYAGAQMIEFDLRLTKDSVLVVIHDSKVDRTTDGEGDVSEYTYEQIRQLDAGIKTGKRFKGTRIPTLEEVLDIMPKNIWLNCHIKGGVPVAKKATQIIANKNRLHQAFLACKREAAAAARAIDSNILICSMERRSDPSDYARITKEMDADFIQLKQSPRSVTREFVDSIKQNGIKIGFYQHKIDPEEVVRLFKKGVEFILVSDRLDNRMFISKASGIRPVRPEF